jgi:hypothetical protein
LVLTPVVATPRAQVSAFLACCHYYRLPDYRPREGAAGYLAVRDALQAHEAHASAAAAATAGTGAGASRAPLRAGRLFYLATPPEVFPLAAAAISAFLSPPEEGADDDDASAFLSAPSLPGDVPAASAEAQALQSLPRRLRAGGDAASGGGEGAPAAATATATPAATAAPLLRPWVRVIVEKPFGRDGATAGALEMALRQHFPEEARFLRGALGACVARRCRM